MFTANPEEKMVQSSDGEVTVTGLARVSAPFSVSALTAPSNSPIAGGELTGNVLFGQSYRIEPASTLLPKPVVLTWQLGNLAVPAGEVGVFRFNEESLMWEMVETVVALKAPSNSQLARGNGTDAIAGGELSITTSTLGVFSLGQKETVTVPEFVEVYRDILTTKPEGAVGFVTTVGYAREGESIIKLPSAGQQGGCGGAVRPGESEQKSTVTREVILLVDDVQTKVTLTFFTRWLMGDGCPVDAPFISSSSHGILPTS